MDATSVLLAFFSETMISSLLILDLVFTLAGILVFQARRMNQKILSISGGLMMGVALVWILPDMAETIGFGMAGLHAICAAGILFLVDRYIVPVCPCCTHHHHDLSATSLWILATAISIHNLFDGWMAEVSQHTAVPLQTGLLGGLLVHKIPEAILFGMMLRSVSKSRQAAILCAVITSLSLWLGALAQKELPQFSGTLAMNLSLSLVCGSFLFVGIHTFIRQRKYSGGMAAFSFAAFGITSTFVFHHVVAWLLE
jgi:zinc transporter ZupT